MISLELCEISFFFEKIKTTTAKTAINVLSVTIIFTIFEAVLINQVFNFKKIGL